MSPEGPNLRRYYLPGLEHLKLELSCFELLLSSHQPLLHQHLLDAGLPAVLYAAQWLMTTYACPFPIHVSPMPDGWAGAASMRIPGTSLAQMAACSQLLTVTRKESDCVLHVVF
jgi:hypothetical protein